MKKYEITFDNKDGNSCVLSANTFAEANQVLMDCLAEEFGVDLHGRVIEILVMDSDYEYIICRIEEDGIYAWEIRYLVCCMTEQGIGKEGLFTDRRVELTF